MIEDTDIFGDGVNIAPPVARQDRRELSRFRRAGA
jgi:hypothetical protein